MIHRILLLSTLAPARPWVRPISEGTMFESQPRIERRDGRLRIEFRPTEDILEGAVLVNPDGSGDKFTSHCWTFSRLNPPLEIPPREESPINGLFKEVIPFYPGRGSFDFLTIVCDTYPLANNKRLYTVPTSDGGTSFCYARVDAKPPTRLLDESVDDDCSICLNQLMNESSRRIQECSHRFHVGCLSRWLSLRRTCPICRSHVGS